MDTQAPIGLLAAIWGGMLVWAGWTKTISLRWASWTWDEQPAQFAAVFVVHATIAFILIWQAAGFGWSNFLRSVGLGS